MSFSMWQLDGVCTSTGCSDGASDDYPDYTTQETAAEPTQDSNLKVLISVPQLDGVCTSAGCSDGASDDYPEDLSAETTATTSDITANTVFQLDGVCTASGCSDGSSDEYPVEDPAEQLSSASQAIESNSLKNSVSSVPQVDGACCSSSCDGASDDDEGVTHCDQNNCNVPERAKHSSTLILTRPCGVSSSAFVDKIVELVGRVSRLVNVNREMDASSAAGEATRT